MNAEEILSKILSLLRVRTKVGGLEISDTDLRFVYFKGDSLGTASLRLPPGIIEEGDIKNYDTLVEALKKLRELIPDDFGAKKTVNVVVTLGSVHIYTQVFSLPLMKDETLKEAVRLNIKMVSPFDLSQAYAGWQAVSQNEDELKIEILSVFAQKVFVDRLRNALMEAGFLPVAVESGALSFARLIRERAVNFKKEKPLLVMSIDDKGLRFLIIRLGHLHFEYFQSWKDIQGEMKEISWPIFEEAVNRNLRQVLNFYSSHWQEPLTETVIASNTMVEEISKIVKENFSLNVSELRINLGQQLRREWYEAVGGAIRGKTSRANDEDINLFGITVQEEFRRHEIISFVDFWKILCGSWLAVLLVLLAGIYIFLTNVGKSAEAQSSFKISSQQSGEISELEIKIKNFNNSVEALSKVQKSLKSRTAALDKISAFMGKSGITADRIYFQSVGLPVTLSGETDSQDKILNFKNALMGDPMFSSVNLNLSDIKQRGNVFYFTLNFGVQ